MIFLGKEQKDSYARKYIAAEKVLRGWKYAADEELKACRISNKEKGKLYRSMNGAIRFGVILTLPRFKLWECQPPTLPLTRKCSEETGAIKGAIKFIK